MTNIRQLEANRENGRSTGPRTHRGKARSSTNARRHGLSISVRADPLLDAKACALARAIAGEGATPERMELAGHIAEAEVDLARIREARLSLIQVSFDNPRYKPAKLTLAWFKVLTSIVADMNKEDAAVDDCTIELDDEAVEIIERFRKTQSTPERVAARLAEVASQLSPLERYERRALSRRKTAIRRFYEYED